ncbi:receptor-type tyrosine-protein phosphatase kappa-like [Ornithodoros turicata]|uniref:receptor-type tyrosine-protein phosphatase kappa-like n=1 Tax=Ornithodoros turicata TaxID=34597 RepID=UPI003138D188
MRRCLALCCFVVSGWIGGFCGDGADARSIDCTETAETFLQSTSCGPCTVHCKHSCHNDTEADVLGTEFYALASSICKSALHDLRISSWNASARTVTFVASPEDDKRSDFTGSVRFNIPSRDGFRLSRYFYFTSPRITEEVLDITMLHRNFIYSSLNGKDYPKETPSQECHVPPEYTAHFDYTLKELDLKGAVDLSPRPINGYYNIVWPKTIYPHLRTNMFWCRIQGRMTSDIASPAMFFGDIETAVPFLPKHYTTTVSLDEPLDIEVVSLRQGEVTSWVKVDGHGSGSRPILSHIPKGTYKLHRNTASLHHGGVYVVNGPHTRSPGKNRALLRVIVRMCKARTYGPLCESTCPGCKNGGVCHDITGRCICPPGFKGKLCEEPCGDDNFGRHCQKRCSDTNPDPQSKTCSGIMICLPDPYGCSCGTGFKGPFCNEKCSPHEYGADCKQNRICFCKNGSTCNGFTGTCLQDNGQCLEGWKNSPFCDISYPLLKDKPELEEIRDTSAKVSWNAWKSGTETGEGVPSAYWLQYKEAAAEDWTTAVVPVSRGQPSSSAGRYSHELTGLKPYTFYDVRVVVRDSDNKYRTRGAQEEHFRTHCGRPSESPSSIRIDNSRSRMIIVKWENPPRRSWNCWTINVTLMYNDSRATFNLTHPESHPKTNHSFPTKPYTLWNIKLRMETPDGEPGEWTAMNRVFSAQDAPSPVLGVTAVQIHPRSAIIGWLPPSEPNGILRNYGITYQAERLLAPQCYKSEKGDMNSINVTYGAQQITLRGLKPYAQYVFVIRAFTIKAGTETTLRFNTSEAVPDGMASFTTPTIKREYVEIRWSDVPCDQANGIISTYHVTARSLDPWDTEVYNQTTTKNRITFNTLVPYNRYDVRVIAENGAGLSRLHDYMNFTTLPIEPLAPTSLVAEQQSRTSISLTWDAPNPPYGVLASYTIVFRPQHQSYFETKKEIGAKEAICRGMKDRKKQCFTIEDLQPDTKYFITVSATNVGTMRGPPSEEIEAETKELPPDPPRELSATDRTEHSIRVEWKEPLRKNGVIKQYRLNTSLVHSYDVELLNASRPNSAVLWNTSVLWYDLKPLFPGCTYGVCVEASTSAGFGLPECREVTTKASVPVVEAEPSLERIVNNTVHLKLSPITFKNGPISNYYVLVVRGYDDYQGDVNPLTYQESRELDLPYYVAARVDPKELKEDKEFVVGDDSMVGGYHNVPLEPTTPYRFALLVESNFSGEVAYAYRLSQPVVVGPHAGAASVGTVVAVMAVLLLVIMFATVVFYYQKRRRAVPYRSKKTTVRGFKETLSRLSKLDDGDVSESRMTLNMDNGDCIVISPTQSNGIVSVPVPVKDFPFHVQRGQENGKLKEEYMSVGRGQLHPWEIAKRPENKSKNRYGNILPYDHSRVVLSRICDPDSDYINANYVPGHKNPRRYIATQGPKPVTIADFWRMVWEENSCKIVMLTNLKEQEKVKCEQYWPESIQKHGEITVRTEKIETYVDFVVREFSVTNEKEGSTRQVVQFHFTTWPDHGVPVYPDAMQPFMKRVREFRHTDSNPIIVHCSGGIGRTGTFILVDSMMDQSEAEGQVNLMAQLRAVRQNRINLVESLDQYLFAHQALVEILCSKSHKMTVKEFTERFHMLRVRSPESGKSIVEEEFQELSSSNAPANPTYKAAMAPQNTAKNRTQDILAVDARRAYLSVPPDSGRTDYINAVYVDGFKRRNAFLVTQFPLPDTVADFWQMVATSNARTIVSLDKLDPTDKSCPQFWPDLNTTAEYYGSSVHNEGMRDTSGTVVRTFRIEQPRKTPRIVRQFHLQEWPLSTVTRLSCDVILDLIQQVEQWQRQTENKILIVQCMNGCTNSGLYCASSIVCDQLKMEQELDAFRSVQTIRNSRPQFIHDQAQYEFLYDVALAFLDRFDAYSNFQ